MWDMRRRVHPEYFPSGRTTVQFSFSDVPVAKRQWWFVSATSEVDMCPIDPGFGVDLYVTTDLKTLTRIWMGDLTFRAAQVSGDIELEGPNSLREHFDKWLGCSAFAEVKDARQASGTRMHPPECLNCLRGLSSVHLRNAAVDGAVNQLIFPRGNSTELMRINGSL
jgi:hypothetical protein